MKPTLRFLKYPRGSQVYWVAAPDYTYKSDFGIYLCGYRTDFGPGEIFAYSAATEVPDLGRKVFTIDEIPDDILAKWVELELKGKTKWG